MKFHYVENESKMIIAGTGHRPSPNLGGYRIPNPIYNFVMAETKRILLQEKPDKVISGMALGFDTYLAECCVELRIPFMAAIPFLGQEKAWPEASQIRYNELLELASEKVIVSEGTYAAWKMQKRNIFMIDSCDKVLACFDGSSGGTANAVNYARSIKKETIILDPRKAPK